MSSVLNWSSTKTFITMTQQAQGTRHWNVSKHYSLQGDSSEEEETASGKGLRGGYEDCVCCVCGETFTFLNNLIEHFNMHKGEVRCHLCQVTFTRAISLALHLENAHPNYNLFCESCNIMFWSTWHMNQHMGQHFEGKKVEPPNDDIKPPQSETQKPLWLEVEEVMVKTEEVEIKCVKDEEEEVPLGNVQEMKESTITEEGKFSDHNYCCMKSLSSHNSSKKQKENDTNISSEPVSVFNNKPNTEDLDPNDEQEEKVEVLGLHSLPQREGVSNTDTACKGQILGHGTQETVPNQETTQMSSLSSHQGFEQAQMELNVKLEDDSENNLLECAPIEEDAENAEEVENVELKEESDSSLHSSLYSPVKDLSSDADSAFDMSTDYNSDSAEEGSVRLLRSRAVKKRRVRFNTNEKSVSPENGGAGTDPSTSNCSPLSSIKISSSNENHLFSNYTCLSCLQVFPNQKTFIMHSCGKFKVTGCRIKRFTKEDHLYDHNYSSMNSIEGPFVSNQTLAHHTHSSNREQKENSEPVNMFNEESDTEDSESECEQQENVEIVVLRSMPQIEGVTNTGRVVLQAAYEKVIKTQVREEKPRKKKKQEQETPHTVTVKLEPEQLELGIKMEDHAEANLWECAPIEEDIKEEENTEIKEESDNTLDLSVYSPVEDSSTETDAASGVFTDDNKSDHSEEGSMRKHQSSTVQKDLICTKEKSATSVDASTKLATLKRPMVQSSVKVSAGPQSSMTKETPLNSVKPNAAPEPGSSTDLQICSLCGHSRVPNMKKPTELCRCMPNTCYMCGEVCGSNQLLLKHQTEKHPLTKYICSTCVQVFPNQSSFASHSCCKPKFPRRPKVNPANSKKRSNKVKNPPTMFLKFIQSPAVQASSNQPLNSGGSQTVASPFNFVVSNNVVNIVDASQKLGGVDNTTISLLPNNLGSTQTMPMQVIAPVTPNNGSRNVASLAVNGKGQASGTPMSTATWANTGQMQVMMPSYSPASEKLNQTEIVFQGGVPSQPQPVLSANPFAPFVPESLSDISAPGYNQSKVTLRIPSYPSNSNKVSVSFSPTPVQFPTPTLVSAGSMKTLPSTSQRLPGFARSFVVPKPAPPPPPHPVCSAVPPLTLRAPLHPSIINPQDSCSPVFSPDQTFPLSQGSLKIVTMFVNQSQELALQKRLRQTWRTKTVFPCRHCGIIARQPSLSIRHRYQHRRPRLHKCQCGKAFQQRLHLLRHQVQHAEAVRYVCAACGQTFHGTHQLASHKHKVLLRSLQSNTKKLVKRDCRNLFHCDCGQGFARSSALLWHMLKNSKSCKRSKKGSLASDLAT